MAPTKSARQTAVRRPPAAYLAGSAAAIENIAPKSVVPKSAKQPKIPRTKPKSPMRFTMNAFLPASAAQSLFQ